MLEKVRVHMMEDGVRAIPDRTACNYSLTCLALRHAHVERGKASFFGIGSEGIGKEGSHEADEDGLHGCSRRAFTKMRGWIRDGKRLSLQSL